MAYILKIIRKKYFKILLSIVVIISLGVALLFGLMNGVSSVHKSIDNFIDSNNYPDIKIITDINDVDLLNTFNKNDYKSLDSRLSISTIINKGDKVISVKASTFEDKNLNDFYVWNEINNTTKLYEMFVEKKFSTNNNINLGDKISLKIEDNYYDFIVTKIISIPEAIVSAPISGLWGEISDYGNVYINKSVLVNETNKIKNELLDELLIKEVELDNEELRRKDEFKKAKKKIDDATTKYNKEKDKYTKIKNELNDKKDELNNNKETLIKLKKDYIKVNKLLKKASNYIDSYISFYDSLSDDAKEYIKELIKDNYPEYTIDDIEFLADILFDMLNGKIDEVFDPTSDINEEIQNKITTADGVLALVEFDYEFFNDYVPDILERINNGEDLSNDIYYMILKMQLEAMSFLGPITDDNIAYKAELVRIVLNEIHNAKAKLPFDTVSELYDTLDSLHYMLPFLYEMSKSSWLPKIENYLDFYNEQKEVLLDKVDVIYKGNKSLISKTKSIKTLLFNYVNNYIDDYVINILSDYTDDLSGGPIAIIDRLLKDIKNGVKEIDKNINEIDSNLNYSYKLIKNNKKTYDKNYYKIVKEIKKLRTEIEDKRVEIESIKGYESKFNEINIKVDDSINKEELLNSIKSSELKDIKILDSYTYDYSPVKNSINYNIVGMENVSTIIPTVFYIIILIVLFLFISLMIKQSKNEIAIFRLLGKSKNTIRLGYCLNNLLISIFGILLGLLIGGLLMQYIVKYYQDFIMLPKAIYEVNPISIVICTIVTIVVVELATLLATFELDKITPIEVLNNEKYQDKDISKLTKFITSLFNPLRKFSFIVYIRNKRNLILGIACTSATFALIFTSLAYVASKDKIFYQYFDDRINYDAQLFETGDMTDEYVSDIRNLPYVTNADLLKYYNVTIKYKDKEVNTVINALDNKHDYIRIYDKNNNKINYPEEGLVIEEHIANKLGVKVNDVVDVNNIKFKITDISFQSLGRVNYIALKDANKLNTSFTSLVLNMDNNKHDLLVNKVSKDNNYVYTVNYDTLKEYNKKEFDSYVVPAIIIIVFSMVIGFIIVVNINYYNLVDQKKNLSVFRSLGFHSNEISKNMFIQSITQWVTSIIIGLPVGIVLSKFVLKMVSSDRREYIYASGIKEILITVILLFVYIVISHLISMRKINKLNISEEIKDRG